jgi:hypothetical protein
MNLFKGVCTDTEGERILYNAAVNYLWDSGLGCKGIHVFDMLPLDVFGIIIKYTSKDVRLSILMILSKKFARLTLKFYQHYSSSITIHRLCLFSCKNNVYKSDKMYGWNTNKWKKTYQLYDYDNTDDMFIDIKNNPSINFNKIICNCYGLCCGYYEGYYNVSQSMLNYFVVKDFDIDLRILNKIMVQFNPLRDLRMLLKMLKTHSLFSWIEPEKVKCSEMEDYIDIIMCPIGLRLRDELQLTLSWMDSDEYFVNFIVVGDSKIDLLTNYRDKFKEFIHVYSVYREFAMKQYQMENIPDFRHLF